MKKYVVIFAVLSMFAIVCGCGQGVTAGSGGVAQQSKEASLPGGGAAVGRSENYFIVQSVSAVPLAMVDVE